jgi:hypothetical protein
MAIIFKTNKVNLFVSSVLCVFWYHSPNVLDTLHICNISWLKVNGWKTRFRRGSRPAVRINDDDDDDNVFFCGWLSWRWWWWYPTAWLAIIKKLFLHNLNTDQTGVSMLNSCHHHYRYHITGNIVFTPFWTAITYKFSKSYYKITLTMKPAVSEG